MTAHPVTDPLLDIRERLQEKWERIHESADTADHFGDVHEVYRLSAQASGVMLAISLIDAHLRERRQPRDCA